MRGNLSNETVEEIVRTYIEHKLGNLGSAPVKDLFRDKFGISTDTVYKRVPDHVKHANRSELQWYLDNGWDRRAPILSTSIDDRGPGEQFFIQKFLEAQSTIADLQARVATLEAWLRFHKIPLPK
jgi:hypothetical protein